MAASYCTNNSTQVAARPGGLRNSDATVQGHLDSLSSGDACGCFQKDLRADVCLTPAVGPPDGDIQEFGCLFALEQCHSIS